MDINIKLIDPASPLYTVDRKNNNRSTKKQHWREEKKNQSDSLVGFASVLQKYCLSPWAGAAPGFQAGGQKIIFFPLHP